MCPLKNKGVAVEKPKRGGMDITFFVLTVTLLGIGLIMLFSASYAYALYYYDDSFHFIKSQLAFAVIGLAGMIIVSYFDYHWLHKLALPLYGLSLVLLVLALFSKPVNDAHRWIWIAGRQFQPSELAKFAIILMFAHMISLNASEMGTFKKGVLPFAILLVPVVGLIAIEPHLSGTILVVLMAFVMMFIGGTKFRWFMLAGGGVGGAGAAYILFSGKVDYAMSRIKIWLNPFSDPTDKGHQTLQSLYAIGSGGLLGQGLGNSRQKYLYVPEPQNDFIFSIVCEELGFIGASLIIIVFALFVWRGFVIAMRARDKFGSMLVLGLSSQIGIQAILNIGVVTNTIPNTGISLPFFSSGGSSLVMLLLQMGVILSVSRYSVYEKT